MRSYYKIQMSHKCFNVCIPDRWRIVVRKWRTSVDGRMWFVISYKVCKSGYFISQILKDLLFHVNIKELIEATRL